MTLRKTLFRFGGKLQRAIVPGLRDSQYVYKDIVESYLEGRRCWLELGCGHHVFGEWMVREQGEVLARASSVVGLDYEFDSVRKHKSIHKKAVGDVYRLPLKSGSFDLVTANMVMEHIQNPAVAFGEIHRTLSHSGIFIFHTPNARHYQFRLAAAVPQWLKNKIVRWLEGRRESDVFPTFYKVNTKDTITSLATATGYTVREIRMVNSSPETYMLGPLVALELMLIRFMDRNGCEKHRSNIIAVLEKAGELIG